MQCRVTLTSAVQRLAGVIVLAAAATEMAWADIGFLLPNTFHADDTGRVTAIASFSDQFPSIEHPLRSQDFHIIRPSGRREDFSDVQSLDQLTVLTTRLVEPGVYRLSSGNRLGRKGEVSVLDNAYIRLGPDGHDREKLPPDAPIFTSQTETVSEVYVQRGGEGDWPATLATSGRLALALSDQGQGDWSVGSALEVVVTFDGKPLPKADITLVAAFDTYTDAPEGLTLVSNAEGAATFITSRPGPSVVFVRHIDEAPPGAATDLRSYTTALVFELTR